MSMNLEKWLTQNLVKLETQYTSPNYSNRSGNVQCIVLHATASRQASPAVYWFMSLESKVSAHYVVAKDGTVYRMVPDEKRAWHAGKAMWNGRTDVNDISIGIEIANMNDGDDIYTDEQVHAVAVLCRYLTEKYKLPPGSITSHYAVSYALQGKTDPQGWRWNDFSKAYKSLSIPADEAITPVEVPEVYESDPNIVVFPGAVLLAMKESTAPAAYKPAHSNYAPLFRADKTQLSTNFNLSEFRCHDYSYDLVRVSPKLIAALEDIRRILGGHSVSVSSGHRPRPYNNKVSGAADNSYHIDGLAADIKVAGISPSQVQRVAIQVIGSTGGVGMYSNFTHVDVRGYMSRW